MAAERIGKAWSGGWIGYHSRVYKADLQPVLPGEYFDTRWGLDPRFAESRGRWGEHDNDKLVAYICKLGKISLEITGRAARELGKTFERVRDEFVALLAAVGGGDEFMESALKRARDLRSHDPWTGHIEGQIAGRQFRCKEVDGEM